MHDFFFLSELPLTSHIKYNVLSAHSDSNNKEDHSRTRDTVQLCEFVQSEIVGDDGKLKCTIPSSDFPRLQHIFCISGNLRASLSPTSSRKCLRDFATSVSVLLPRDGRGGFNIRHLLLAACITGLFLCEAMPQGISEQATARGFSLNEIGQNGTDMMAFVKNAEHDLLQILCGTAKLFPAIFLAPGQASRMMSIIFAATRGVFPALCEENQHEGGLAVPTCNVTEESSRVASVALLGIARKLQEDNLNSGRGALVDGAFQLSPSLTLLLYYLAYSLFPSPSTCNNTGILLSETPWTNPVTSGDSKGTSKVLSDLAQSFYEDGLRMDEHNPHILVNLGSLMRESGDVDGAIKSVFLLFVLFLLAYSSL